MSILYYTPIYIVAVILHICRIENRYIEKERKRSNKTKKKNIYNLRGKKVNVFELTMTMTINGIYTHYTPNNKTKKKRTFKLLLS